MTRAERRAPGRVVTVKNGRLFFARSARALAEELTWLGGTRFALGAVQLRFDAAGDKVQLTLEPPDGTRLVLQRSSSSPAP